MAGMSYASDAMCGIVGVLPSEDVDTREALGIAIELLEGCRNRGEDGTGLLLSGEGLIPNLFHLEKWFGSAHEIPDQLYELNLSNQSRLILGHTRYATRGVINEENIHPVWVNYINPDDGHNTDLFIVMNGDVSFTDRWVHSAQERGINLHDSETDTTGCAGFILERYLDTGDLGAALTEFYKQAFAFGAFSILGMMMEHGELRYFYIRDGMRPLHRATIGEVPVFVSETKPLTAMGVKSEEIEVVPGGTIGYCSLSDLEWTTLNMNETLKGRASRGECAFEYAYFQEPNSIMHGMSMDRIRSQFGKAACREHPPPVKDKRVVVSPIPKSGISAANGYAEQALRDGHDVHLEGVILRRGSSNTRSFLGEGRSEIVKRLRGKFEINPRAAKDAVVINVDDSIVRGNVSAWINKMEREAGADEVRFVSAWPPIIGPCFAGIAIDVGEPLAEIVDKHKPKDIAKNHEPLEEKLSEGYEHEEFGQTKFDGVAYVSPKGVKDVLKKVIPGDICTGCFTGKYNYINPLNINQKSFKYKKWLDEFCELNGVDMPEEAESDETPSSNGKQAKHAKAVSTKAD